MGYRYFNVVFSTELGITQNLDNVVLQLPIDIDGNPDISYEELENKISRYKGIGEEAISNILFWQPVSHKYATSI